MKNGPHRGDPLPFLRYRTKDGQELPRDECGLCELRNLEEWNP